MSCRHTFNLTTELLDFVHSTPIISPSLCGCVNFQIIWKYHSAPPPLSLDLAPCLYFHVPKLKTALKRRRFKDITTFQAKILGCLPSGKYNTHVYWVRIHCRFKYSFINLTSFMITINSMKLSYRIIGFLICNWFTTLLYSHFFISNWQLQNILLVFLISNFHHVLNVVCFLLGNSPGNYPKESIQHLNSSSSVTLQSPLILTSSRNSAYIQC
jgi:hypothetical protein